MALGKDISIDLGTASVVITESNAVATLKSLSLENLELYPEYPGGHHRPGRRLHDRQAGAPAADPGLPEDPRG